MSETTPAATIAEVGDRAYTQIFADPASLTAEIVSAFVRRNDMPAAELPALIRSVHDTFVSLDAPAAVEVAPEAAPDKPTPAVPVKKSVFDDKLISLIDGKPYQMLKRHLAVHGHTPDSYRKAFDLPDTYPMVAKTYAAKRRGLAQASGLGKKAPVAAAA